MKHLDTAAERASERGGEGAGEVAAKEDRMKEGEGRRRREEKEFAAREEGNSSRSDMMLQGVETRR